MGLSVRLDDLGAAPSRPPSDSVVDQLAAMLICTHLSSRARGLTEHAVAELKGAMARGPLWRDIRELILAQHERSLRPAPGKRSATRSMCTAITSGEPVQHQISELRPALSVMLAQRAGSLPRPSPAARPSSSELALHAPASLWSPPLCAASSQPWLDADSNRALLSLQARLAQSGAPEYLLDPQLLSTPSFLEPSVGLRSLRLAPDSTWYRIGLRRADSDALLKEHGNDSSDGIFHALASVLGGGSADIKARIGRVIVDQYMLSDGAGSIGVREYVHLALFGAVDAHEGVAHKTIDLACRSMPVHPPLWAHAARFLDLLASPNRVSIMPRQPRMVPATQFDMICCCIISMESAPAHPHTVGELGLEPSPLILDSLCLLAPGAAVTLTSPLQYGSNVNMYCSDLRSEPSSWVLPPLSLADHRRNPNSRLSAFICASRTNEYSLYFQMEGGCAVTTFRTASCHVELLQCGPPHYVVPPRRKRCRSAAGRFLRSRRRPALSSRPLPVARADPVRDLAQQGIEPNPGPGDVESLFAQLARLLPLIRLLHGGVSTATRSLIRESVWPSVGTWLKVNSAEGVLSSKAEARGTALLVTHRAVIESLRGAAQLLPAARPLVLTPPVSGLANPHMVNCWVNSVLQVLRQLLYASMTPRAACRVKGCLCCALFSVFELMSVEETRAPYPSAFIEFLTTHARTKDKRPAPVFDLGQFGDPAEFLQHVLNRLAEPSAPRCSKAGPDAFGVARSSFVGELRRSHICLGCSGEFKRSEQSLQSESFNHLMLSFPASGAERTSVQNLMRKYTAPELIKRKCSNCGGNDGCVSQSLISVVPAVLCLCLPRTKPNDTGESAAKKKVASKKDARAVDLTEQLEMDEFVVAGALEPGASYRLQAVIEHVGEGVSGGHYLSYHRGEAGAWTCMNDGERHPDSKLESIAPGSSYMLFYVRSAAAAPAAASLQPAHAAAAAPLPPAHAAAASSASSQLQLPLGTRSVFAGKLSLSTKYPRSEISALLSPVEAPDPSNAWLKRTSASQSWAIQSMNGTDGQCFFNALAILFHVKVSIIKERLVAVALMHVGQVSPAGRAVTAAVRQSLFDKSQGCLNFAHKEGGVCACSPADRIETLSDAELNSRWAAHVRTPVATAATERAVATYGGAHMLTVMSHERAVLGDIRGADLCIYTIAIPAGSGPGSTFALRAFGSPTGVQQCAFMVNLHAIHYGILYRVDAGVVTLRFAPSAVQSLPSNISLASLSPRSMRAGTSKQSAASAHASAAASAPSDHMVTFAELAGCMPAGPPSTLKMARLHSMLLARHSVVMKGLSPSASWRCTVELAAGGQCEVQTYFGECCKEHARALCKLEWRKSCITEAGTGLFASDAFDFDSIVAVLSGTLVVDSQAAHRSFGPYVFSISVDRTICSESKASGYARLANSARESQPAVKANAGLKVASNGAALIRATEAIAAGAEIVVEYGEDYWRQHGSLGHTPPSLHEVLPRCAHPECLTPTHAPSHPRVPCVRCPATFHVSCVLRRSEPGARVAQLLDWCEDASAARASGFTCSSLLASSSCCRATFDSAFASALNRSASSSTADSSSADSLMAFRANRPISAPSHLPTALRAARVPASASPAARPPGPLPAAARVSAAVAAAASSSPPAPASSSARVKSATLAAPASASSSARAGAHASASTPVAQLVTAPAASASSRTCYYCLELLQAGTIVMYCGTCNECYWCRDCHCGMFSFVERDVEPRSNELARMGAIGFPYIRLHDAECVRSSVEGGWPRDAIGRNSLTKAEKALTQAAVSEDKAIIQKWTQDRALSRSSARSADMPLLSVGADVSLARTDAALISAPLAALPSRPASVARAPALAAPVSKSAARAKSATRAALASASSSARAASTSPASARASTAGAAVFPIFEPAASSSSSSSSSTSSAPWTDSAADIAWAAESKIKVTQPGKGICLDVKVLEPLGGDVLIPFLPWVRRLLRGSTGVLRITLHADDERLLVSGQQANSELTVDEFKFCRKNKLNLFLANDVTHAHTRGAEHNTEEELTNDTTQRAVLTHLNGQWAALKAGVDPLVCPASLHSSYCAGMSTEDFKKSGQTFASDPASEHAAQLSRFANGVGSLAPLGESVPFDGFVPSVYVRDAFAFFAAHVEQSCFLFIHLQVEGQTVWIIVAPTTENLIRLDKVFAALATLRAHRSSVTLSEAEALAFGRCWFKAKLLSLTPNMLTDFKVEFEFVELHGRTLLVGCGRMPHFGFSTAGGAVIAHAVNAIDEEWLAEGPGSITRHFEWVAKMQALSEQPPVLAASASASASQPAHKKQKIAASRLAQLMDQLGLSEYSLGLALNMVPPNHTCALLKGVLADLRNSGEGSRIRNPARASQQRKSLIHSIDAALKMLHKTRAFILELRDSLGNKHANFDCCSCTARS